MPRGLAAARIAVAKQNWQLQDIYNVQVHMNRNNTTGTHNLNFVPHFKYRGIKNDGCVRNCSFLYISRP